MIELDELAELAWLPVALLAALLVWRSRLAVLTGPAGGGRLQAWRAGPVGAAGNWMVGKAGLALRWLQGVQRNNGVPSGNQSFDAYRDDALRRLEDEQREFRAFLERLRRARDQSEFDAFMADRAR
jgi:hypothetical protein